MINLARQAFGNPFQPTVGSSFQSGSVGSPGRCPFCGNAVAQGIGGQSQAGFNPGFGTTLGQQGGGNVPPYWLSQATGFGQGNPLAQFAAGVTPGINPMSAPAGGLQNLGPGHQGTAVRGSLGIDPRYGVQPPQFGYPDPNIVAGLTPIANDPLSSLLSQQLNPWAQQQLPIRPLIGAQQGFQQPLTQLSPGIQWADPYRTFVEAQLISQLANNPLYQLQRAFGGVPEFNTPGVPFSSQQFNPLVANSPFFG